MEYRKLTYWSELNIRSWRDYEKTTSLLILLPDNDEITVIVVYSIRYNKEKGVQGWVLLDPASSGAAKVQNPNALESILRSDIPVAKDGYCHIYLSNGSAPYVNFDNFHVSLVQGKIRQINDYYPYGMAIYGLNGDYDDYLNKYTGKEYQTGEFDPSISQGLEMFDFGSRFYDAQLGRWHTPDPAEQFSNPYLGMGNNPIMYKDPNGEWVHIVIGAVIGGAVNLTMQALKPGELSFSDGLKAFGIGAAAGAIGAATGGAAFVAAGGGAAGAGGFAAGFVGGAVGTAFSAPIQSAGNNIVFGDPYMTSGEYGLAILGGGVLGGAVNGGIALAKGNSFWSGNPKGGIPGNAGVNGSSGQNGGDLKAPNPSNRTTETYTTQGDGWEISIDGPTYDWTHVDRYGNVLGTKTYQYGSNLTYGNSGSAGVPLRSFTYGNFRTNLGRYTGHTPSNSHAHHIFPNEFREDFIRLGIQHNHPKYGSWWQATDHLNNANSYNQAWRDFIRTNPNAEQALQFGRRLMQDYGFKVNF